MKLLSFDEEYYVWKLIQEISFTCPIDKNAKEIFMRWSEPILMGKYGIRIQYKIRHYNTMAW